MKSKVTYKIGKEKYEVFIGAGEMVLMHKKEIINSYTSNKQLTEDMVKIAIEKESDIQLVNVEIENEVIGTRIDYPLIAEEDIPF